MDSITSTADLHTQAKTVQENLLLDMIKELCYDADSKISVKLRGKVTRIIADCDLTHHTSLHKLSTTQESTSTLLGFMHQTATELTFDEQIELNQAIVQKIQKKLPQFTSELENLKHDAIANKKNHNDQIRDLQQSLDDKLNVLQQQENEKVELMMEWLNHRINEVSSFNENSTELLTLKSKILDLKSKILHLQILQNIFTETNQSIKAYSEVHKDLKDSIKDTEKKIKEFHAIIDGRY